jgi:uncharacterized protein HemX
MFKGFKRIRDKVESAYTDVVTLDYRPTSVIFIAATFLLLGASISMACYGNSQHKAKDLESNTISQQIDSATKTYESETQKIKESDSSVSVKNEELKNLNNDYKIQVENYRTMLDGVKKIDSKNFGTDLLIVTLTAVGAAMAGSLAVFDMVKNNCATTNQDRVNDLF